MYKYLFDFDVEKISENEIIELNNLNYLMKNGVLRQQAVYSSRQSQTQDTFGFKWGKRSTYESKNVQESTRKWLIERYLEGNQENLSKYVGKGTKILDAGCGSGLSSTLLFEKYLNIADYVGVDISNAVDVAKKTFDEKELKGFFVQADLLNLPFNDESFDIIFSEGVLHHTDSTEKSLKYLSRLLVPKGRFMFYVYKKKAPIREFTDDFIRNTIKDMNNQEAWESLLPLTKLGKVLGDLHLEIEVPEDIPFLEISKGKIDIQRLFYWYIFKAYYKENFDIQEMNHINFDWYRPLNCHRHSPEEIKKWCREASLNIEHIDIQESGITVVAQKQ